MERHYLAQCINPSEGLSGVYFHTDLTLQVNKQKDFPVYLKQLVLKIINSMSLHAIPVYSDVRRNHKKCSGSGTYIKSLDREARNQKRNSNYCTVFRSELIAIDQGLTSFESVTYGGEIWFLSTSRSSNEHLSSWYSVRDDTGANTLKKLKRLSSTLQIHLQWIPSNVDIKVMRLLTS